MQIFSADIIVLQVEISVVIWSISENISSFFLQTDVQKHVYWLENIWKNNLYSVITWCKETFKKGW